ncbi:MAG: ABC transporter substrate-binding protein [Candidatus Binatia bacterium]
MISTFTRFWKFLAFFWLIAMFESPFLTPMNTQAETAEKLVGSLNELSAKARQKTLLEGAKREGRVVFYGTANASDARKFLRGFKQKYPFLTIDHYRAGGFRLVNKVTTEARAGRYEPDIIQTSALVGYELLRASLTAKYFSPERKYLRKEFYDKNGNWTAMMHVRVALGYNTESVHPKAAPKSYEALQDPKWKGKVVIDTQDQDVLAAMIDAWGKERAYGFFRGLAKNQTALRRSRTLQAQLLAAGEFQIAAFLHGYRPAQMKRQGAPVGVAILSPFVTKPIPIYLAKHAQHSHAAILLYDYLLSQDCQNIIAGQIGRGSVRIGTKERYPELTRDKYQIVNPETAGPKLRELRKFFDKTFMLGGY